MNCVHVRQICRFKWGHSSRHQSEDKPKWRFSSSVFLRMCHVLFFSSTKWKLQKPTLVLWCLCTSLLFGRIRLTQHGMTYIHTCFLETTHSMYKGACEQLCKQSELTIPVVFSLGFFMMMATCSLTALINWSATPGCVCRTVQQMWMLGKRRSHTCILLTIYHNNFNYYFSICIPGWVLQCVQIPALWRQSIRQTENIKNIWAYCHHWHLWIPKHKHTFYLADSEITDKNKHAGWRW